MYNKAMKYMAGHPMYNGIIHALGGIGVGVLITYPYIDHPLRVGGGLLLLAVLGHLYPLIKK